MRNQHINNAIARALSADRLNKYLLAANSDLDAAIAIYEKNTRLAEAFYTPLQAMEICFRNHLDRQMASKYGADWLTSNVAPLGKDARVSITKATADLQRSNSQATPGAIVAELSFGFWVALLAPRYDASLGRSALFKAFAAGGKAPKRQVVHGRMNALRRFRNRVAHHEPIFQLDLEATHDEILGAIRWMCVDTAAWAEHHSRFNDVKA